MTESRNITVLFTDLVDSTALASAIAPEAADDLRRRHFSVLRRAIANSGGTEVKNVGDGLMAVFPAASAAFACAVAMQQAVHRDNTQSDQSLGLRVGLSAGEATHEDSDYFGDPVIEAARLCACAEAGQILTTNLARAFAGRRGSHIFTSLGALQLKGLPEPIETLTIEWAPLDANAPEAAGSCSYGLLGPLVVTRDGEEVLISGERRRALLLRLLVSGGQAVPTKNLIEDIWEGSPPRGAASTIQSHISALRKVLGGLIRLTAAGYVLNLQGAEFDSAAFEADLLKGRITLEDGDPDRAAQLFQRALDRWRGEPLIDVGGAAWALPEISRLRESKLTALELLLDAQLAAGRHLDVVPVAEAAVSEHPLRESVWAQLMLALYRSGRQADALRAFQRLRTSLGEELGIEPTRDLVELEEAIVLQKPDLEWKPREPTKAIDPTSGRKRSKEDSASVPLPDRLRAAPAVFVGREDERAMLEQSLKAAVGDGQTRVVLIGGEPGIGKSSLSALFAKCAFEAGATVLFGRCDQDLAIPYQPWREALVHLIAHAPPRVEHVVADQELVLGTLGVIPDRLEPLAGSEGSDLYALFSAILGVLAAAAGPKGLVIVLDDIHGADAQSMQLLRRLAGGAVSMPALVVATFRESEVLSGSTLAGLLADLRREPRVSRVSIRGLNDIELLSFLEATAGHDMDDEGLAFRDALLAETDGNPFFVGELLRHLVESGSIVQNLAGRWVANSDFLTRALPASLLEVIGERVARLGDRGSHILTIASVIGREFELSVLAEASHTDSTVVLDELEAAIAASLVVDFGSGRFSFTHALIERALFDQLSATRRAYTHLQVAEAIEKISGGEPERAAELARHWMMATIPQDTNKALIYAKRAADHALARLAPDEARRWYAEALILLEQEPHGDPRMQCELLVGLGDAERQCGDPCHRATLLRASHLAIALDDVELLGRAALANWRGFFAKAADTDVERVEVLEAAAERTFGRRDELRVRVLALLVQESAFVDDHLTRSEMADEALSIARELDDPPTLLAALNCRVVATQAPDVLEDLIASTEEALSLAERIGNPLLKGFAASWRYCVTWQAVDRREADRMWEIMMESTTRLGQPTLHWLLLFFGSHRATVAADFVEAARLAEEALEIGLRTGQPDAFDIYGAQILRLHRERDVAADIIPMVEGAFIERPTYAPRAMLSRLYCDTNRLDHARELVRSLVESGFDRVPRDIYRVTNLELLADTVTDLNWVKAGELLIPLLQPYAAQWDFFSPSSNGPVARPLARLFATVGDHEKSDQHFRQSLEISSAMESPLHLAHTYLDWGRALATRPHSPDAMTARNNLTTAARLASEHGLNLVGRLASQCLAMLG